VFELLIVFAFDGEIIEKCLLTQHIFYEKC